MQLQIFDVEHGACSLLTADNNTRLIIDCGHNSDTGWRPGTYLRERNITTLEILAVSNYDEDHVSGAKDLFDKIDVRWLWRNKSVSSATLKYLKSQNGMGRGIGRLAHEIDHVFTGSGNTTLPMFEGVIQCTAFWNKRLMPLRPVTQSVVAAGGGLV
jgi:hypothetical protein